MLTHAAATVFLGKQWLEIDRTKELSLQQEQGRLSLEEDGVNDERRRRQQVPPFSGTDHR